jgi:hypothetical protein
MSKRYWLAGVGLEPDLGVMNEVFGRILSIVFSEGFSHQGFRPILHSLRWLLWRPDGCAVHSGHKLETVFSSRSGPFVH